MPTPDKLSQEELLPLCAAIEQFIREIENSALHYQTFLGCLKALKLLTGESPLTFSVRTVRPSLEPAATSPATLDVDAKRRMVEEIEEAAMFCYRNLIQLISPLLQIYSPESESHNALFNIGWMVEFRQKEILSLASDHTRKCVTLIKDSEEPLQPVGFFSQKMYPDLPTAVFTVNLVPDETSIVVSQLESR